MLKTALKRGAVSFFFGVAVSQFISILISFSLGDQYLAVLPDFAAHFPNEIIAIIVQAVLTGLISTTFAASSVLFMMDKWSFLKQCAVHFCVTSAVWIPIVTVLWMPRDGFGVAVSAISFSLSYLIVWVVQIAINRHIARQINEKIMMEERENERH